METPRWVAAIFFVSILLLNAPSNMDSDNLDVKDRPYRLTSAEERTNGAASVKGTQQLIAELSEAILRVKGLASVYWHINPSSISRSR